MASQHLRIALEFRAISILIIASLTLGLTGCSVATNDSTNAAGPLKLTLPNQACLKDAMPTIQRFFQGAALEEDLNNSWGCFSNALRMFTVSTRGENPDFYTARELRTFLETFFLGDVQVSDQLLNEVMRIKQILVGGAIDRITRLELAQAQNVLEVLRIETQRVRPYMKLITLEEKADDALRSSGRVEAAIDALKTTSAALGTLFGHGKDQYDTESLETLFAELKPIFKGWNGPLKALNYLPTFQVAKTLLLNPSGNRILPTEWQPLFTNAGQLYGVYLRFHYTMSAQDMMTGAGLSQLTTVYEEAYRIIRGGIEAKPAKMITYPQIDATIDELFRLNILDDSLRDTTIKGVVRTLTQKVLNPMSKGSRSSVKGLTLAVFDRLYIEGQSFLDMQRVWQDVMARAVATDPKYKTTPIPLPLVRSLWDQTPSAFTAAKDDLHHLFNQASPMSFRENGTVIFDNRLSFVNFTQRSFNKYNWVSAAIRMIMNGYSSDPGSNRYKGVTQDQLHAMFADIHELGVDLRILEPKDDNLWLSSFTESNMFMLSADANDLVSYAEAFDFMSYMLGGGIMTHRAYADARDNCSAIGQDAFGRPTMEMSCFRTRFQTHFTTIYAEMPWWVKTANDLGSSRFSELMQGLEVAARKTVSDNPISTSDTTRMTMVMQYIESIFVRFDKDRSGKINYDEALQAFPLLKDAIDNASGFHNDHKNMALFYYLLEYGKAPTSLSDKVYFQLIWLSSEGKWKQIEADRLKILGIIGAIKGAQK